MRVLDSNVDRGKTEKRSKFLNWGGLDNRWKKDSSEWNDQIVLSSFLKTNNLNWAFVVTMIFIFLCFLSSFFPLFGYYKDKTSQLYNLAAIERTLQME